MTDGARPAANAAFIAAGAALHEEPPARADSEWPAHALVALKPGKSPAELDLQTTDGAAIRVLCPFCRRPASFFAGFSPDVSHGFWGRALT